MRNYAGTFKQRNGEPMRFHPAVLLRNTTNYTDYRAMPDSDYLNDDNERVDVLYDDGAGTVRSLTLRRFKMPTGAATVTIGSVAWSSAGVGTFTPSKEGYMLATDGTLLDNTDTVKDIAGLLLTDYFLSTNYANDNRSEAERCVDLREGDVFYVIVAGDVEVYADGATTANRYGIAGATAGQTTMSAVVNTGGTIAQYNTSLLQNGVMASHSYSYVRFTEALGAAGLAEAQMFLPGKLNL